MSILKSLSISCPIKVHTIFRSFKLICIAAVVAYLGAFCNPRRCKLVLFVFRRLVSQHVQVHQSTSASVHLLQDCWALGCCTPPLQD